MPQLIALVAVAVMVGSDRLVIAPGEILTELAEHDVTELKRSGAIEDLDETAAADKAATRAANAAMGDFEREKKAIAAAQASIAPEAPKAPGKK